MRTFERVRVYLLLGLGVLTLGMAGAATRMRLTTIDAAVASRKAADDALAGLSRVHSLLEPDEPAPGRAAAKPAPSAPAPPTAALGRELDGLQAALDRLRLALAPASTRRASTAEPAAPPLAREAERIRRELDRIAPILSEQPAQQDRLDRLRWLVRKKFDPMTQTAAEAAEVGAEIHALLAAMEREEGARHARVHAEARSSELTRIAFATALALSTIFATLIAASLVRWEVVRRRWARGKVASLVSQQRELTQRLEAISRIDPLTGLPNRTALGALLEARIRWAADAGRSLAVVVADVNRLEHLNAMLGFEGGDEALKLYAQRLGALAADGGVASRLSGGEFVVALPCGPAAADALAAAESVQQALAGGIRVGGQEIAVTSNVGVACFPKDGADARTLLGNAELALNRSRDVGRNCLLPFDEALSRSIAETFLLERQLSTALQKGEYAVLYQPYWGLESRSVMGAEALVKWRRAGEGLLSAARFVPTLEETGMILDVGRWVLETSCGQIREWADQRRGIPVSVNLSGVQFRDRRLAGSVGDAIAAFRLDPGSLTLEVTESTCLGDMDFAIRTLKTLKDLGVTISIDDFGTGYSSLSYLKRLPADIVKIDVSFVRDVATDQDSASIIAAIATLARSLNLKTIAEGVETEDQRKILHLLRCDMGQGFLFSPAVPAPELEALLARRHPIAAQA